MKVAPGLLEFAIGLAFCGALALHLSLVRRLESFRIWRGNTGWWLDAFFALCREDQYTPDARLLILRLRWSGLLVVLLGGIAGATVAGALW